MEIDTGNIRNRKSSCSITANFQYDDFVDWAVIEDENSDFEEITKDNLSG